MQRLRMGIGFMVMALVGCDSTVEQSGTVASNGASSSTSSTSSSTSSSSAASGGSGGAGVGGGAGGSLSELCQTMQQVTLDNPTLTDAGLDGDWSAGETATLSVTLTSPVDTFEYPGVRATHGTSGVTPNPGENWLFGLLANQPTQVDIVFDASPQLTSGTAVTFMIEVAALNHECPDLAVATLGATIQ